MAVVNTKTVAVAAASTKSQAVIVAVVAAVNTKNQAVSELEVAVVNTVKLVVVVIVVVNTKTLVVSESVNIKKLVQVVVNTTNLVAVVVSITSLAVHKEILAARFDAVRKEILVAVVVAAGCGESKVGDQVDQFLVRRLMEEECLRWTN